LLNWKVHFVKFDNAFFKFSSGFGNFSSLRVEFDGQYA
jgi:hypothetical protein